MRTNVLDPNRRNLAALGAVTLALLVTHVLFPTAVTRYTAYLTIFAIWMAWFVLTVVQLLSDPSR